jgi:hypothetical protein
LAWDSFAGGHFLVRLPRKKSKWEPVLQIFSYFCGHKTKLIITETDYSMKKALQSLILLLVALLPQMASADYVQLADGVYRDGSTLYITSGVTALGPLQVNPSVVYSFAATPPACVENTFTGYGATLHMPATSYGAYFVADYWGNFANMNNDAVEPTGVTISSTEAQVEIGKQLSLTANVTPSNATPSTVRWSTTDSAVATVNNGVVTAMAAGECDIVATCIDKQAVCHVSVVETTIVITLDKHEARLLPNHSLTITPTMSPIETTLKVTVSNPEVAAARLMNGVVQVVGLAEGSTMIVVSSVDGQAVPDACMVTVYTEIGDVNCDGYVNISDVTDLIDYLLSGDGNGVSKTNADCDKDGNVNIADVTALIDYLLIGTWPWEPHGWVDLGLPSGTLWATCNVGAESPEVYGDYFAWGETEPKDYYDWSTYKWCNGSYTTMTKYCTSSSYGYNGFVDNKTELEPEDDAAYVNWGPSWRMPTKEQQDELREKCTWTWTTQNGVNGRLVTGPNGNTLFLPAAGCRWYGTLNDAGSRGYYWSRTLYSSSPDSACSLDFFSGRVYWDCNYRRGGRAVRAVRVSQN